MVGSPGLLTALWHCEPFGKGVDALEDEFCRDMAFVFGEHLLTELLFEILAYYEHYFSESGLNSVVDGIVHDGLAVRS